MGEQCENGLFDSRGRQRMLSEETLTASEADHLRQQLLRAQKLSSVGTLASSVVHEFNNILTTIINYAKLGLHAENNEARTKAFEKILNSSQRAAAITTSMLGFARKNSSRRELHDITGLVE